MGWLRDLFIDEKNVSEPIEKEETVEKNYVTPTFWDTIKGIGSIIINNSAGGRLYNTLTGKNTITETIKGLGGYVDEDSAGGKVIDVIEDKIGNAESVFDNTPSDEQNEEFKDDSNQMLIDFMKGQEETRQKELQEAYEREDAIRKETQEREDTAYQRAVEDMRKAGINPNLVGISPSASGGGITSASRTEQVLGNEINAYTSILNSLISKDTTMSEGDKDRITNLISSASQLLMMMKMFGGK